MARTYAGVIVACSVAMALGAGCSGDGAGVGGGTPPSASATARHTSATLELGEYLVRVMGIQDEENDEPIGVSEDFFSMIEAFREDPGAYQAFLDGLPETTANAVAAGERATTDLQELLPPPEARVFHNTLIAWHQDASQLVASISDAILEGDDDQMASIRAQLEQEKAEYYALLGEQDELTIQALRSGPQTPRSQYLIGTIEARAILSPVATQGLVGDLGALIPAFEALQAAWSELSPPPDLATLHQAMSLENAESLEVLQAAQAAIDEGDVDALRELFDETQEGSSSTAEQLRNAVVTELSGD